MPIAPATPHIPAAKTPLGELAVWLLIRSSLRRAFARVRLHTAGDDPRTSGLPLLYIANHPSWWDGYLALLLARSYGRPRWLMIEEAQLRRYRFFSWAGGFSVDRADPRESARSIAYAAQLLATEPRAFVGIFPQAEITPSAVRPVAFHAGAAHIVRRATADGQTVGVLPIAWELVFRGEQHPEVFIHTGPILRFDRTTARDVAEVRARCQAALTCAMDAVAADLRREDFSAYRTILRGSGGINDLFDRTLRRPRLVPKP